MQELNEILDSLQSEDIDVDELSSKVRRATELIRICRQKIQNTELEVENILKKFGEFFKTLQKVSCSE